MANAMTQRFSIFQITVVIIMGIIAGCITSIQPLLLGGLLEHHQLSATQLGHAAAAETLGSVVVLTLAAIFFKPTGLRSKVVIALLIAMIVNSCTGMVSGAGIIALRFLNGACSGILFWVLLGMMARAAVPSRLFAIYVTFQAVVSFAFALLIRKWLLPVHGPAAGYVLFAAADLLLLFAVVAMPLVYQQSTQSPTSWPPLKGMMGLASVGFLLAAVMGFWVYVLPLGQYLGHPSEVVESAVNMAIGVQIFAGICAVVLANKLQPISTCIGGALIIIVAIAVFINMTGWVTVYGSLMLFAFVWMFIPSFQLPLLLELDPSLRSAIFIGTAQQAGVVMGPTLSSQIIKVSTLNVIAQAAILCAVISIVLVILARALTAPAKVSVR
ncbi:hypothetical protein G8770_15050 [Aestuariicella hydrocarbonica]|uniref:MFS transporter n=1 Tax=Pseudomaricurvus hydrocarbonicus TaxID=1470433 RepID=A0A9E5JU38_9GAMM|nr:hypothetical protein [Aestuariicella hydrocarbonica]NHO66867.1 hypothetical protein [Aestuariicella hydrocarbonica]